MLVQRHTLARLSKLPIYAEKKSPQRKCRECKKKCSYYCTSCSDVITGVLFCFCNPHKDIPSDCYFRHLDRLQGRGSVNMGGNPGIRNESLLVDDNGTYDDLNEIHYHALTTSSFQPAVQCFDNS